MLIIRATWHATVALTASSLIVLGTWLWLKSPVFPEHKLEVLDSERIFYPVELSGEAIWAKLPPLNAIDFPLLALYIEGRTAETEVAVLWRTAANPTKINQYSLPWPIGFVSTLNLNTVRQWTGQILNLGIAVGGRASGPVRIHSLNLQSISALGQLQLLWTAATSFEGFKPYTINFIYGGLPVDNGISGTVIIEIWVTLAGVLILIWQFFISKQLKILPFYIIFFTGWLILDIRWQIELLRQHELTVHEYAGQSAIAKRLNGKDGSLFRFITSIKNLIPPPPQRILLIPSDQDIYTAVLSKASFYLRPHNVYAIDTAPLCQHRLRSGDYVLALGTAKMLNYIDRRLLWEGCNSLIGSNDTGLIADRIAATAVGQLFLITATTYAVSK